MCNRELECKALCLECLSFAESDHSLLNMYYSILNDIKAVIAMMRTLSRAEKRNESENARGDPSNGTTTKPQTDKHRQRLL